MYVPLSLHVCLNIYLFTFYLFVCVTCMFTPRCTCGCQRTTCRRPTIWVLGIELWCLGSAASTLIIKPFCCPTFFLYLCGF